MEIRKPPPMRITTLFLLIASCLTLLAPLVQAQAPTITTAAATSIAGISATAGGSITLGAAGNIITERGLLYTKGKVSTPPATASKVAAKTAGAGAYTCTLTGLVANTDYSYWAYVTYKNGLTTTTVKGGQKLLTTATLPAVTTWPASQMEPQLDPLWYRVQGEVVNDGRSPITARGVAYGFAVNPTTSGSTAVVTGTAVGSYYADLRNLIAGKTYYARAYATNAVGTAYGANQTFTTPPMPDLQPVYGSPGRPRFLPFPSPMLIGGTYFAPLQGSSTCSTISAGTLITTYPCGRSAPCSQLKHTLVLPPVEYSATNAGNAAAGPFPLYLMRDTTSYTDVLKTVGSQTIPGLAPGASSPTYSFTPAPVEVYTFPEEYPGQCFQRCGSTSNDCYYTFREVAYVVEVDGGNARIRPDGTKYTGAVVEGNEENNAFSTGQ